MPESDWEDVDPADWEDVATPAAPPAKSDVTGLESAARGGLQGLTAGFGDELQAGIASGIQAHVNLLPQALLDKLDLVKASEGKAYEWTRDRDRAANKAAEEANPDAYLGGEVVGGVAGALLPVGKAAKGLKGAMKAGAILGGAAGLGGSEADLLKGEVGQALLDTGVGAVAGAGGGALGHGASKLVGRMAQGVRDRASTGLAKAFGDAAEIGSKAGAKGTATAKSEAGNASQRMFKAAEYTLENPDSPPELVQKAKALLLRRAQKGSQDLPGLETAADDAVAAFKQATGDEPARAAEATANALSLRKQITPRIATLGHRMLPAGIAALGGMIGGTEGAAVGGGVGGLMALAQGRPGIVIRNLVKSPAFRANAWGLVRGLAGRPESKALGKFAPMLSRAAAEGEGELKLLHAALLEKAPEYAAALAKMVSGEEEAEPVAAAQ